MARNFDTPFMKGVEAELSTEPRAMTPIERAARALASSHYALRFGKPSDDPHVIMNVDACWPDFEMAARDVLQAIREPSEAMHVAVVDEARRVGQPISTQHAWEAMIDAALAEGA